MLKAENDKGVWLALSTLIFGGYMEYSNCCYYPIILTDICSYCKEHCDVCEEEKNE